MGGSQQSGSRAWALNLCHLLPRSIPLFFISGALLRTLAPSNHAFFVRFCSCALSTVLPLMWLVLCILILHCSSLIVFLLEKLLTVWEAAWKCCAGSTGAIFARGAQAGGSAKDYFWFHYFQWFRLSCPNLKKGNSSKNLISNIKHHNSEKQNFWQNRTGHPLPNVYIQILECQTVLNTSHWFQVQGFRTFSLPVKSYHPY